MHLNRWRLLLASLMLVVMPLQGIAATLRPACHAASAPAQPFKADAQYHETSHQHGAAAGEHTGTHSHDHHAASGMGHADAHQSSFAKAKQCHACSPCCAGVLVSVPTALTLPDSPPTFDFFLTDTRHPSPPLAGLDRPPRTLVV